MKTLILDNYDSFTYNLYQYIGELHGNPVVYRNDEITIKEIEKLKPTHIIISPGPGTPEKASDVGICSDTVKHFAGKIPILGVCLGHQIVGYVFGGEIKRASRVMHGKTSQVKFKKHVGILKNLTGKIDVMRYHSLMVAHKGLPKELEVTAETTDDNTIMALQHKKLPIYGIQFHPESIGTPNGKIILKNFLKL